MQAKKAKNQREAEKWRDFQIENRNLLVAKDKQISMRREQANAEPEEKTKLRITLEKPIYKAREIVTGYRRLPGNHYGLTQEEASFYGKSQSIKIKT